jgi:hypothetical protein
MKYIAWFEHTSVTTRIILFTLSCAGAFPSFTSAQTHDREGSTSGFSLGGHVALIGINPHSFDLNGRATNPAGLTVTGGGVTGAYGLNEWLTIAVTGAGHESEDDRHFAFADIGAQVFLSRGRRLRPHVDIALTGRRAEFDVAAKTIDTRGDGLSLGGGALYFFSKSFAIDAAVLWTPGDLDRYTDGERGKDLGAIGVSAARFLIGVRWFPGR